MEDIVFQDIMSPGVILSNCIELSSIKKYYPDYLQVDQVINLSISDKLNPSDLPKKAALVYNTNLYITDENGNIGYFDCDMHHTDNAGQIRKGQIVSRFFRKNNSSRLVSGDQPAMISDRSSSSGAVR